MGMCLTPLKDYLITIDMADKDNLDERIKIDHYSDKYIFPSKALKHHFGNLKVRSK